MERQPVFLPPVPAYDPPPAPEPAPPAPAPKRKREGLVGTLLLVGGLLLKFGKVAFVALKGAKFLTTSASMLVSVGAYALIWGWKFGVGFVVLLLLHEMGHVIQLRREGIKTSPVVFIPFMGAVVGMKEMPDDAAAEARVGLAGPILGTIASGLAAVPYLLGGGEFWLALAFVGFFLNLFNLLPVTPLDGGRAMAALAPWMWFVGLGAIFVLVFLMPNPILVLIALVGAFDVYTRWKKRGQDGGRDYYRVTKRQRAAIGATFLLVLVACVIGMDLTHVERDFDDV